MPVCFRCYLTNTDKFRHEINLWHRPVFVRSRMTRMDTVRQTTYKNKRHLSQSTQRSQRMVIFLEAVRGRFQETALPAIAGP